MNDPRSTPDNRLRDNLGWALAYMAGAYIGLTLAVPPGSISPIWPASGVALAALLIHGRGVLPGLFVGACTMQLLSFYDASSPQTQLHSLFLGIGISAGSLAQAWLGYHLARRYLPAPLGLIRSQEVLRFIGLCALLACTVAPSVGVAGLLLAGAFGLDQAPTAWLTWWVGDSLGVLIVTPLILAFLGAPASRWRDRRLALGISMSATLLLVAAFFHFFVDQSNQRIGLAFNRLAGQALDATGRRLQHILRELEYLGPQIGPLIRGDSAIPPDLRKQVSALAWLPASGRAPRWLFGDDGDCRLADTPPPVQAGRARVQIQVLAPPCRALALLAPARDDRGETGRVLALIPLEHLGARLEAALPARSNIRLSLRGGPGPERILYQRDGAGYRHAKAVSFKPAARRTHPFGDRQLELRAVAPSHYVAEAYGWDLWAMLVAGFGFSGVLGAGLLILTGQKRLVAEQVESRTRALADEVEEHRRTEQVLELQNRILELIARNTPMQETLDTLCRGFEAVSRPGTFASVMLVDHRRHLLRMTAGPSIPRDIFEALMELPIGENEGSCGTAVFRGEQVLACDIGQDIEWHKYRDFALGKGLQACWSTPFFDADGQPLGSFALTQTEKRSPTPADHTHMKVGAALCALAVEQARRAELLDKLHLAVEQNPNAIAITDTEGRVEYVNARFFQLTGRDSDEVIGRILPDLLGLDLPPDERLALWDDLLQGREWRMKARYRRKDGRDYWAQCYAAPVRNREGEVTHVVAIHEDVTELHEASQRIAHQATHDQLTGLLNRYAFEQRLAELTEQALARAETHTLCYIDMDRFKAVNDSCGHLGGDELLRQFSQLMRSSVRRHDTVSRLGGDEFGILFEHCDRSQALANLEQLRRAVENHRFIWGEQAFHIGFSAGLVEINAHSPGSEELLREADAACYQAKQGGRNQDHAYQDDQDTPRQSHEMALVNTLRGALEEERLHLFQQPIRALAPGTQDNMEILLRLALPDGSLATAGDFLPAAERFGMARTIDTWVMDHTFEYLARHPGLLDSLGYCAINLSGLSLSETFARHVSERLGHYGLDGARICLEITETAAVANLSQAQAFMRILREQGVRFALDDFGSGLSSFGYLKTLPVDVLKIDGQFVRDMLDDPGDLAIVRAIAGLGDALGCPTVAEFVENEALLEALRDLPVDFAQGYAIARPAPLD